MINQYILIVGNTGVGKTTVADYLASHQGLHYYDDPFVNNPFLAKALCKENNLAFQSQLYFFKEFIRIHKHISVSTEAIIQERSIFESVKIFCKMYYKMGVFSLDELMVFQDLLSELKHLFKLPDLVIYLKSDPKIIYDRIKKRNRESEIGINMEFIETQLTLYEEWICELENENKIKVFKFDNTDLNISQSNILIEKEVCKKLGVLGSD